MNPEVWLGAVGHTLCKAEQILWAELKLRKGKNLSEMEEKCECVCDREGGEQRQITLLSFIIQDCMYKFTFLPNISVTASS